MKTPLIGAALIYVGGQLFNFFFQLLLLHHFGLSDYGVLGLAHLIVLTVLFVADLGYASLFLREDPLASGWEARWRMALVHRLVLTVLLDAAALAGWRMFGGARVAGWSYLVGALPATWFGLINYSAPMLALGHRMAGLAMQQVAWPVAWLGWLLLSSRAGAHGALLAGLTVSLGFMVQAIVNAAVFRRPRLLRPAVGAAFGPAGMEMLRSALHVAAMGIGGTLHDRLTPFLVARLAPGFLPIYILIGHVTNGASGIFNQFNRLLMPLASTTVGVRQGIGLMSLLLLASAIGGQLLLGVSLVLDPRMLGWLDLTLPVLLGWSVATMGGVLAAMLIGRHREHALSRLILAGLLVSSSAQLGFAALGWVHGVLWARLACLIAIMLVSLRLCRLELSSSGRSVLGACVLAGWALHGGWLWIASVAILLLPLMLRRGRPQPLFRPIEASIPEMGA